MSDMRGDFEPFACAPGLRLEAHERLSRLQFETLEGRLVRIEAVMERLERRLWLALYGVVAAIVAQALERFMAVAP